jgi:manganese oxidase
MANDFAPLNAALVLALLMVVVLRIGGRRLLMALTFTVGALWIFLSGAGLWTLSEAVAANPPQATDPGDPCPSGGTPKTFNVSLINIPLFLNRFADVVPEGRMYILDENIAEARAAFRDAANPFQPKDIIEPLVLRVNHGDCVEVAFTNRLNEPAPEFNRNDSIFKLPGEILRAPGTVTPAPREFAPARTEPDNDFDPANAPPASMHFDGLDFDVKGSDGTAVGNNPNSTVQPGQTAIYRLFADQEGEFQFKDAADLTSHQGVANERIIGSTGFGAFGGIIVEPENATFADINTGEPLKSGTRAIIEQPNRPDFRENVLFMHDEVEAEPGILTRFCIPPETMTLPTATSVSTPPTKNSPSCKKGPSTGSGAATPTH